MKVGIIKERKIPVDKRVPFSPQQLVLLQTKYEDLHFVVESSDIRCYTDEEYVAAGISVVQDVSDCDVLFGVKEIPIAFLIPNKKYFFFSHTIKKQVSNRELLQQILKNNIELYDYETIVDLEGKRLIGFGYYAGIVGGYNAIRLLGLKYELFKLPTASRFVDKQQMYKRLKDQFLPAIKIVVTGKGRVSSGICEVLNAIKIKPVSNVDFLNKKYSHPVYTVLDSMAYFKKIDGTIGNKSDFYKNPRLYTSDFEKYTQVSDILITGHFQSKDSPPILINEMLKNVKNKLQIVADVSCDIDDSIVCTVQASSIDEPFYGYLASNKTVTSFNHPAAISVMAITNLPCELAKDASDGFGEMLINAVMPAFFNNDQNAILSRSKITEGGKLTSRFLYLENYVNQSED